MEISSGHNGAIRSLDIENIQSRYLLTGGLDCKICLYDLYSTQMESNEDHPRQNLGSDAKRIIPLSSSHKDENSGHSYAITSVQWYPTDNESFFSSSFDGKLNVWETELFEIAGSFQCGSKIYDCAIHPQNYHSLVACATESSGIRLCDLNSGDSSHTLGTHSSAPRCLDWCPYHEYTLVSGSVDGTVCLWDIRKAGVHAQYLSFDLLQDHSAVIDRSIHQRVDWNRQLAAKAHSKAVTAVKFTPGGRHLVSCGNDKCVRLWDAQTGKLHPIRYDPCCHSTLKYEIDIVGVSSSSSDDLLLYPGPDSKWIPLLSS